MADDQKSDRVPERPRTEPEIIPPGSGGDPRDRVWTRYEDAYGVHRIYIARPGLPSLVIGLLLLAFIAALVFVVVAGITILLVPLTIAGVLLALASIFMRGRRGY